MEQHQLALLAHSRATGVQYLTFFGVFWLIGSLMLPPHPIDHHVFQFDLTALLLGVPLAAAIYVWTRHTKQATAALAMSSLNEELRERRARIFRVVNVAQYIALGVMGLYLSSIQRIDLLIPVGIFIIGAHFLPLAFFFKYPFHLVTGILLIAWALLYPHVLEAGGWNPMGPSGTGVILLLSAAWSSYTASRLARLALR